MGVIIDASTGFISSTHLVDGWWSAKLLVFGSYRFRLVHWRKI